MSEVQCARISLRPGSLPTVWEWAQTLNHTRRSEALATMADEGVSVESYFLESNESGDFLIAYIRAESLERAAGIASRSRHDIDRYHQEVKQTAWDQRVVLEPLVDLVVQR